MIPFDIAAPLVQEVVPIVVTPAPTFADQIVPIAVAVATAIGIIMAAVLPAIKGIRDLVTSLKADVKSQGEIVSKLEVNTNSISEKLRVATAAGALAEGNLAGRAELKSEQNAEAVALSAGTASAAPPVKVEVANADPVKVQVEKKL